MYACDLQLFNSILLTLPRLTTSSGGKSPADAVLDLAGDIMGKLPVNYDMEAVSGLHSFSVYYCFWCFHLCHCCVFRLYLCGSMV